MKADPVVQAYAQALYQIALAEDAVDKVEDELYQIRKMMESQRELRGFMRDASLPAGAKKKALAEIVRGKVSSLTMNHLEFVIDQGRADLVPGIAEAFSGIVFAVRNQMVAEVTTAVPLTPELEKSLQKKLSAITDREVVIKNLVDSSIIGGVVVRLGDKVLDGSIRHSLGELREALATA